MRNGDSAKPIWASEIGWNALPSDWTELPLLFGSVSRELQAAYTVRAYQRAAEQWPWMDVMAVWHLRKVHPDDVKQQDYYFDLVTFDWKPEPVYYSLKSLMTAPPVVRRGFHQENDWALTWSPGWATLSDPRASLGEARVSSTPGARLSFDVDARWLDLVTVVGPAGGTAVVTVDGSALGANRLPLAGRVAQLNLRGDTELWTQRIALADGLAPGPHHVEIQVLSGQIVVDGVVADTDPPRNVLIWQFVGSLVGFVVFVRAIVVRPLSVVCDYAKVTGSKV